MKFSKEIVDEANIVSDLQNSFKEMNGDNYEENIKSILKSPFFSNNDTSRYNQFWMNFHICLRERPFSIFIFSDAIESIHSSLSAENKILFSQSFYKNLIHRYRTIDVIFTEPQLLFLVNQLIMKNIINFEEIYKIVYGFFDELAIDTPNRQKNFYAFLYFFAPEFYSNHKNRFLECIDTKFDLYQIISNEFPELKTHFSNFSDNLDKWKENRIKISLGSEIVDIFINDDIEKFMEFAANPNFNINSTINLPFLLPFDYIMENPPLICIAAFFKSINIFRYLFMACANPDVEDNLGHTAAQFAAASGCLEILRFLDQYNINLDGVFQVSSGFSHYDIFEWLRDAKHYPLDSLHQHRGNIIGQASIENNTQQFLSVMEDFPVDINQLDNNGRSALSKALKCDSYDVLKIIFQIPELQINQYIADVHPICFAIENESKEMLDLFLNDPRLTITDDVVFQILRYLIAFHVPDELTTYIFNSPKINFKPILQTNFFMIFYSITSCCSSQSLIENINHIDNEFIHNLTIDAIFDYECIPIILFLIINTDVSHKYLIKALDIAAKAQFFKAIKIIIQNPKFSLQDLQLIIPTEKDKRISRIIQKEIRKRSQK